MTARSICVASSRLSPNSVKVGGFKHALVSTAAACVARRGRLHLRNVPAIRETEILCRLLASLGASVDPCGTAELRIDCSGIDRGEIDKSLSAEIHGSLYLIPSLLAAMGQVRFHGAGGCLIGDPATGGARPIEHIVHVLERFGAQFHRRGRSLVGHASILRASEIDMMDYSERSDFLTGPLVSGATKTAVIASLGAGGVTIVHNPYPKPDVTELLNSIAKAGGFVKQQTNSIEIARSTTWPLQDWTEHILISDLSEIITYIAFAVMTGVSITIQGVTADRVRRGLSVELALLERMEVPLLWLDECLRVDPPEKVRSVDIEVTSVGIYSDHQPFFALMLLKGDRPAYIREHVWKDRFDYARELKKLGADITLGEGKIMIRPSRLRCASNTLVARDLRAAAALLVAGVSAGGRFRLDGAEHLARGYSNVMQNLRALGVEAEEQ